MFAVAALALSGCVAQVPPPVSEKVQAAYDNRHSPAPVKDYTLVTVVGDSYVYGSNMGGLTTRGWTSLASADLQGEQDVDVTNAGVGGSGYVTRGPKGVVFSEVLPQSIGPKSDLVVFFGSINDRTATPEQVRDAASKAYALTKEKAQNAKLLVIGPAWTSADVPADMLAIRDALKHAASKAGAAWVDPIAERWFFDQPALIGSDGVHPTDEGHAYMKKMILPHMQKALGL